MQTLLQWTINEYYTAWVCVFVALCIQHAMRMRHMVGGGVVNATPRPLYPRERPGTHSTGDWVGPRVSLDRCGKSRLSQGFDPRNVQPVANRYTVYAFSAHFLSVKKFYRNKQYTLLSSNLRSFVIFIN